MPSWPLPDRPERHMQRPTGTRCASDRKWRMRPFPTAGSIPVSYTHLQLERSLSVMASEVRGKFFTLILRGDMEQIRQTLEQWHPVAMEIIPLTLEEVFLYEMEVKGYDAQIIFG